MEDETRKRLRWVELFLRLENYSLVSRKCGTSRPTLRKWVQRYREHGVTGLASFSRRPKSSPAVKLLERHREWIRQLRKRRLGSRRIQSELQRNHNFEVSRTTIEKVLGALEVPPLSRPRRPRNGGIRYCAAHSWRACANGLIEVMTDRLERTSHAGEAAVFADWVGLVFSSKRNSERQIRPRSDMAHDAREPRVPFANTQRTAQPSLARIGLAKLLGANTKLMQVGIVPSP